MKMGDSTGSDFLRQEHRLVHIPRFLAGRERQFFPHSRINFRGLANPHPQLACLGDFRQQVMHRGFHVCEEVLKMGIDRRQQRKNLHVQTGRLLRQNLGDDERLRITRIPLYHIANPHVREHGQLTRSLSPA